jgi:hypothetical protein
LVLLQYTATTNGSKCLILHSIGHNCTLDDLKRGTPSMLKLNLIFKCTRTALNELLNILRKQGHRLPKDSRTLLKTPRSINTIQKSGGDYLYLGIESGISKVIAEHPEHFRRIDQIKLSFNIDGVPLFKSSSVQLWPILCSIKHFEPFVVAVYHTHQLYLHLYHQM